MKSFVLAHRVIGALLLTGLLVLRADASTRETYNLPAIANLSLAAGAAPTSVVFGRLDGMPASCPVKLAIAIKGEVEANGSTAGFYDEVVLRVGGKEYAAFAGDAWSGPGNWSLSDPYRGKIKSRTFEVEVKPGEEIVLEYLTRNQHWNEGWAQIQSVKLLDGGCPGGNCGGGGGGVGNQCVSLEISLGSQISSDDSAGRLRLKVEQPTATAYTPAALELVTGLYNRTAAEEALASALTTPMVVIIETRVNR